MQEYLIHRATSRPILNGDWDSPIWSRAEIALINRFHPQSSDHRPVTRAKALYDDFGLHLLFDVVDRYVRCVHSKYQDPVCRDSCVEFFVQPQGSHGYFNFEWNCGGTLLAMHITDPQRVGPVFKQYSRLSPEEGSLVQVWHSLPGVIDPERTESTSWRLQAYIPWSLFLRFGSPITALDGVKWCGNFYKCGDDTSHPHWGSWSPIGEDLNFHQPCKFGSLIFVKE